MAKGKVKLIKNVRGAVKREIRLEEENDVVYSPEALFSDDLEKLFAAMVIRTLYFTRP